MKIWPLGATGPGRGGQFGRWARTHADETRSSVSWLGLRARARPNC